ncbi:hypothetical protein CNMCM5623_005129 [Aspergillus felis]|uniref:Uncharacterized protein n=1 Tax=Aspergillus felis TaxID=1287682 RepID=A0A8H6V0G7_9EURO|nr:hypothetical protein CNMCM5623_005129 [Aspergillus felis]KAF7183517.1 hypothetical protein CNMCM7691_003796 [Aspergillus felis]
MAVRSNVKLTTLIIELGGVLINMPQTFPETVTVPIPSFKRLQSTSTWMRYECGEIEEQHCYELLSKQFGLDAPALSAALSTFREVIDYDRKLASSIVQMKYKTGGSLRIVAVWNIARTDYDALCQRWGNEFLADFDDIFTSSALGTRMPRLSFYQHVLDSTRTEPTKAIFALPRNMLNALGDPVVRGNEFLQRNAKNLNPFTDCGTSLRDNYVQLLILETTGDEELVTYKKPDYAKERTWNYYIEQPTFTKMNPPNDLDTTALAIQLLPHEDAMVHSMLDEMLEYLSPDGLIQVQPPDIKRQKPSLTILGDKAYFDHTRPRIDPVAGVNTFLAFHIHQRGQQLRKTIDWIYQVLLHRAYVDGTYYYQTAEWFLFYVCRLLKRTCDPDLEERFSSLLKERIQERIGVPGDSLVLGMRLSVCHAMGVHHNYQDMERLTGMQCEDGGWEPGYLYSIPIVGKKIFDRGFTTALAVQVIEESRHNYNSMGKS